MIEDELLKLRLKLGRADSLRRIYEKYLDYLLGVAMAFVNDAQAAEDIVHDVFVSLARSTAEVTSDPAEDHLICAERARLVYEALARLPDEQREAIVLRIEGGVKFRQIAEIQNASYVAVQARYRRGIDAIARKTDEGCGLIGLGLVFWTWPPGSWADTGAVDLREEMASSVCGASRHQARGPGTGAQHGERLPDSVNRTPAGTVSHR